jgi:ADP-ribose pyrophosphatase
MPDATRVLATGRFLQLVRRGRWEYVRRTNATGAVAIVAVTNDHKLLLTEQFRVPVDGPVLELPAGLTGDEPGAADEPLLQAARRELLEETGYHARHLRVLASGPPTAGLADEVVTFVRASGLSRRNAGGGVGHEQIVVHEVPLEHVPAFLRRQSRQGKAIDPKIFAGLYLLQMRR